MRRSTELLEAETFDILVVGAGVQGAWVALRAAQQGLSVAVIDKHDFGAATSANSLNILHGGLRYLQHLDFARMRTSIQARREFARRSAHLTRPLPCLMPLKAAGIRSPWFLGPALLANDVISADRNSGVDSVARLPMGRLVGGAGCAERIAPLAGTSAMAGAVWWDLLSLDCARLVVDTVVEAANAGAVVANRVQALAYLLKGSSVCGVAARDTVSGREFEIRASVVVNATGPWAGKLSQASRLDAGFLPPGWSGGLNLVLRRSLGIETAVALSTASGEVDKSAVVRRSSRELFFVPWRGVTMVGTDYLPPGELPENGEGPPLPAVEAFVAEVAKVAPHARLTPEDVAMTHWGILPTESAGSLLPRKAPIVVAGRSGAGADGLVVVIGEKLTSAPVLSGKVLQLACGEIRRSRRGSRAGPTMPVPEGEAATHAGSMGTPAEVAARLRSRYGEGWSEVARQAHGRPELLQRLHPATDALRVEVVHAIREEMALGLDDLVLRRLGIGAAGHPGADVIASCAALAAAEWGWTQAQADTAVAELDRWYASRTPSHEPLRRTG